MKHIRSLTRAVLPWLPLLALVVVGVALGGDFGTASHIVSLPFSAPVPVALALIAPIVVPKTKAALDALVTPQLAPGGTSEAIPHIFYDTQLYTSGTTTRLNFFSSQSNDPTITNMSTAGTLPDPQYFEIWNLGFDVLRGASSTVAASQEVGVINDIQNLILVGRPVFTLNLQSKLYGSYPLSALHTSGGAVGSGWGTTTAEETVQYGNNGVSDGGWNWNGSIIIPPKASFSVEVVWSAAQTLAAGNPYLRFWMAGVLHRRVV